MRFFIAVSLLTTIGVFMGCDSSKTPRAPAAPAGSTISIIEINPTTGIPLSVGQSVSLAVKIAYTLTAESGTLGVVVQDANNLPLNQTFVVVLRGSGTESVTIPFTVPATKTVQVFSALSEQGQTATSTVSSRAYKVADQ